MPLTFCDEDVFLSYFVNKPVFIIDSAAPVAAPVTFLWFRLSYPSEWVMVNISYEYLDALNDLAISFKPFVIFIKSTGGKT
jgi:hypothetical protein